MNAINQNALKALQLMDLTSLNKEDTESDIISLCQKAKTQFANVAAVCVYPEFIGIAKKQLLAQNTTEVKIATVTNFPHGSSDIDLAVRETQEAIALGADEVDVVFPYKALMQGDSAIGFELVKACKIACGEKVLKVIIESGELQTAELIKQASEISIAAGADFIKTSTGKVAINATLEATEIMLNAIKNADAAQKVGFKAAGGVRTAKDAADYLALTAKVMGDSWIDAAHFRFGASGLLGDLLLTLGDTESGTNANSSY